MSTVKIVKIIQLSKAIKIWISIKKNQWLTYIWYSIKQSIKIHKLQLEKRYARLITYLQIMGLIQTVYVCTYLRPNFKEMHLYLICFLKTTTLHTQMIEGFSENSKRCNICQTLIVSVNSTKRCSNWHSKYVCRW